MMEAEASGFHFVENYSREKSSYGFMSEAEVLLKTDVLQN